MSLFSKRKNVSDLEVGFQDDKFFGKKGKNRIRYGIDTYKEAFDNELIITLFDGIRTRIGLSKRSFRVSKRFSKNNKYDRKI